MRIFQSVLLREQLYEMSTDSRGQKNCFKLIGIIWGLGHLTC